MTISPPRPCCPWIVARNRPHCPMTGLYALPPPPPGENPGSAIRKTGIRSLLPLATWPEAGRLLCAVCASTSCLVKCSCQEHAVSGAWAISVSLKTALSSPFICNGGTSQGCRGLLMPSLSGLPENHPALTMRCNQTFPSEVQMPNLSALYHPLKWLHKTFPFPWNKKMTQFPKISKPCASHRAAANPIN